MIDDRCAFRQICQWSYRGREQFYFLKGQCPAKSLFSWDQNKKVVAHPKTKKKLQQKNQKQNKQTKKQSRKKLWTQINIFPFKQSIMSDHS